MTHEPNDDRENGVHVALAEYLRRIDAGEAVDREAFLSEHPTIASELSKLLATADQIQQMAGPVVAPDAPEPPDVVDPIESGLAATITYDVSGTGAASSKAEESGQPPIREFGEYELLEELGRGGMGVVYKANQTSIGRTVAVKMIRAGRLATETDVARFYLEAQAAGKLGHSAIVDIYDAGEVEGHHYFSMEYVEGTTLSAVLRQGPLPTEQIIGYLKPVCEAIHYAHENGVLHRDLKPSNILIDPDDQPKVTDFGLAKDITQEEQLTTSGSALGTPSYMSPEQAQARRDLIGRATDVYALGVILYEMLTGRPPFCGASVIGIILQVIHDQPTPPASVNPDCDRDLEAICLKCLSKDPGERYATVEELAEELDRVDAGQPVRARRISPWRRAWIWCRNLPLVAAAMGHKSASPTAWHVRTQWALVVLAVALVVSPLVVPMLMNYWRLRTVEFAAGPKSGTYFQVASALADAYDKVEPPRVGATAGAVESLELLIRGEADLAIVQQNALAKHREAFEIVAPLYHEIVLTIVRQESDIEDLTDLAGRRVALGKAKSGMRLTSEAILGQIGILDEIVDSPADFTDILHDDGPEAAIVTAKLDNPLLQTVLNSGKVRAIPITVSVPSLDEHFEDASEDRLWVPTGGLRTLQTQAVLVVWSGAPDWFVGNVLGALKRCEVTSRPGFFRSQSAWHDLKLHSAAEAFFEENAR